MKQTSKNNVIEESREAEQSSSVGDTLELINYSALRYTST